ncbi:MAG TPA: ankyrin repeat domain-containing protein, partial [Armatimonadota bacterium]|nr:ankyrin repeat domain-containing protein [Armatimonadota bacterium]
MGWRFLLCAGVLGALSVFAVAAPPPRPFVSNRVVMVPYRYIAEWVGATVQYHPETLSVTTALAGRAMMLTINAPTAKVKEKQVLLSIPPTLQQWLTYVPLEFAAETLEIGITWDEALEKVTVAHPRSRGRLVLRTGAERVIFDAVDNGALPEVEAALAGRKDALVARDRDGATPLHVAVRAGHYAVAAMLLLRGAEVNALDARERAPLHDAVALERPDLVRLLVDGGADIRANHLDLAQLNALLARAGQTEKPAAALLHDAVRQQLDDLVLVLIEKGADVAAQDAEGRTALHLAVAAGSERLTALLLAYKAPVNAKDAEGRTPLAVALATGHPAIVRLLAEAGADITAPGIELARLNALLQPAPEPVTEPRVSTPLHTAVSQGLGVVLPLLLKHEDARGHLNRQDAQGNTPLLLALAGKQDDMAKALLEAGAAVTPANDDGDTALHLCARTGSLDMTKLLVETYRAPVDPLNARQYSPLAIAVEDGRAPVAAYLVGKGASLDVPTVKLAALERMLERAPATSPAPAPPEAAAGAATPLHRAAGAGLTLLVQRLLAQGAAVEATDADGATPLHLAAGAGAVPVIEALL